MHAPDGFLTAGTAIATGVVSAGTLGAAVRATGSRLRQSEIPLAGLAAAFIFAAQMVNFPVAAGTTGHLIGGALAAVLIGPRLGVIVLSVVVIVQALVFADGGLTALGYNLVNMAVVPTFGGYAVFVLARRLMPANRPGVAGAAAVAALISVLLAAMAFSIEWLFGASAPVPFDRVFAAMVSTHVLIGVGEAVITGFTISAVLSARPDIVYGAEGIDLESARSARPRALLVAGAAVTLAIAAVVSQFAADSPDGLERVAEDLGISGSESSGLFADYATTGIENEALSLAIAGITGVLVTAAVLAGLLLATRRAKATR